jgi:glucose-6-phosphate 1-epimerase
MQSLDQLKSRFARDGAVAFDMSPLGGIVARLACGQHNAVVALQGAQVLSWRHGTREMLWLSPVSRLGTGKAVRGGIPVCWPWFGPHPNDAAKPAHGFVRTRIWGVSSTGTTNGVASLTLACSTTPDDRSLWPHAAEAELTVTLGETLALRLTTRNTGTGAFDLSQALHTYFRVGDIGDVAIDGLAGRTYIDKLADGARIVEPGRITFGAEVDRIYLGDISDIALEDGARRLRIASTGSRSAVVWNPWIEKTERLGDMGASNAFRRMVCIETANAGDDIVTLASGQQTALAVTYKVDGPG